MKKVVLLLFVCLIAHQTFAQKIAEDKVPTLVQFSFYNSHPSIKNVQWEKEDANFEAQYTLQKINYSVVISADGKILETEEEIEVAQLSKNIVAYVAKNYPNKKIISAAKITNSKKVQTFEAAIKGKDLIFDTKGNFVKAIND